MRPNILYANGLHNPGRASGAGRGVDPLQHLVCLSAGTWAVDLYKFVYSYTATISSKNDSNVRLLNHRYHKNHADRFWLWDIVGERDCCQTQFGADTAYAYL